MDTTLLSLNLQERNLETYVFCNFDFFFQIWEQWVKRNQHSLLLRLTQSQGWPGMNVPSCTYIIKSILDIEIDVNMFIRCHEIPRGISFPIIQIVLTAYRDKWLIRFFRSILELGSKDHYKKTKAKVDMFINFILQK